VKVKNTPDASLGNADAAVLFNNFNGNAAFKKAYRLRIRRSSIKNGIQILQGVFISAMK
jgi:hypothetical protein